VVAALVLCGTLPASAAAPPHAIIVSAPQGTVSETSATITFQASRTAAFQGFECRHDGATSWSRCSAPYRIDGLREGSHWFEVRLLGLGVDATPAHRGWAVALPPVPAPPAPRPAPPPGPKAPPVDAPATRAAGACRNGTALAAQVAPRDLAVAVLCLINAERRRHGLVALRSETRLRRAAAAHASDMVARDYFDHDSPDGEGVADRVAQSGYERGARSWAVGEVQHWAVDARSAPERVVASLLGSPEHRRLLLRASYREAGAAVAAGTPGGAPGATYVVDLGRRVSAGSARRSTRHAHPARRGSGRR
jgi:uncharacterized protein YkwD